MNAKFLVAKFVPDLKRMEPRNIGVVVWTSGHTRAKFLGDDSPLPRRIGIKDRPNFESWVGSWRRELSKPSLEIDRGKSVPKTSGKYLDALRQFARGNYLLVDGGELLEPINESDLKELTAYLYHELVTIEKDNENSEFGYEALKRTSVSVLKSSGIYDRADFHRGTPATYEVHGVNRVFEFDYSLGDKTQTQSFFQRVIVNNTKVFDGVLFNLDYFHRTPSAKKNRVAALVMPPKNADKHTTENIKLLGKVTEVVDVSDLSGATQHIAEIASVVA